MFHPFPPNTHRNSPLPALPQPPPNYKSIEYSFLIIHLIIIALIFILSSSSFLTSNSTLFNSYQPHRTLSQSSTPFTNPNFTYFPLSYDDKSKLLLPMLHEYFTGSWYTSNPPMHFNNNNGTIYIKYRTYKRFKVKTHFSYNYDIYIFDGAYNNRSLFLTHTPIHLTSTYPIVYSFNSLNDSLSFHLIETKLLFNVNELKHLRYVSTNTMSHVNIIMQLHSSNYSNITGDIDINDMSFSFSIKNNTSFIEHNIFTFSSNLIIIGIMLLCVHYPLYKKLEMNSHVALNYSPYLFFVSCMFNCGIGFECFMGALVDERMSNYFAFPCALYLVNACYCEPKIILIIMKHQTSREQTDNYIRLITLRKKIIYFFLWFYIMLILFMFYSCDIFFWKSVNYVFTVLSFLPQIIANIKPYQKEMISVPLICVLVINRIDFICVFRLSDNFLLFEPDVTFCVVNVAIIACEVLVLVLLRYVKVGRVVAKFGRSTNEFDYFKSVKQVMKIQGSDVVSKVCPVCLGGFLKDEHNVTIELQTEGSLQNDVNKNNNKKVENVNLKMSENNDGKESKDKHCILRCKCCCCCCLFNKRDPFNEIVMLTPCGHVFHVDCLQQWMKLKNTCPECRGGLPNYT